MTDQATRVVPAGWYEDPADAGQVRWWNGIAWTDHIQPKPTTEAEAETAELEKHFSEPTATVRPRTRKLSSSTSSSWLLAFTPLLAAIIAAVAVVLPLYSTISTPTILALLVVPYLLSVLWAFLDVRKLKRWGHTPPSALWGLLGPLIYLIVRKVKVVGWGQLVALVVLLVGLGGVGFAVASTDVGRPVTLALTIQGEIRSALTSSGEATDVACPPIADSTAVGSFYNCDVTLKSGAHKTLIVSIDSDAGDYSYTYALD